MRAFYQLWFRQIVVPCLVVALLVGAIVFGGLRMGGALGSIAALMAIIVGISVRIRRYASVGLATGHQYEFLTSLKISRKKLAWSMARLHFITLAVFLLPDFACFILASTVFSGSSSPLPSQPEPHPVGWVAVHSFDLISIAACAFLILCFWSIIFRNGIAARPLPLANPLWKRAFTTAFILALGYELTAQKVGQAGCALLLLVTLCWIAWRLRDKVHADYRLPARVGASFGWWIFAGNLVLTVVIFASVILI